MKNKKGFIFIETIIVTTVLLASLMLIYAMYTASIGSENRRIRYDDVAKLYETYYVKKYLDSFSLDNLKARIDNGDIVQPIFSNSSEIFGTSYTAERSFFENLWQHLHIVSMYLIPYNVSTVLECGSESSTICSNSGMVSYLNTLDDGDNDAYRLVIEYAMDASGNACSSEVGCFHYYSNVKVEANE